MLAKVLRGSSHKLENTSVKRSMRIRDFDAHSPMFRNRHFHEERRNRLFSDRPFIWGRFPKYIIAWALSMQFWAGYYLYHKHSLSMHLTEKTRKANRRTLPFV